MMEPSIWLDVSCNSRIQRLPPRCNPVQDRTLETFCIVRSGTGSTFLYLRHAQRWVHQLSLRINYHVPGQQYVKCSGLTQSQEDDFGAPLWLCREIRKPFARGTLWKRSSRCLRQNISVELTRETILCRDSPPNRPDVIGRYWSTHLYCT